MSLLRSILLIFLVFLIVDSLGVKEKYVQNRPPAVAGKFYDKDSEQLRQNIQALLAGVKHPVHPPQDLAVLIVPHAGYRFSGATAAVAYQLLQSQLFDTIILIGPQHRKHVKGAAVWPTGRWQTPLGGMGVDQDFVQTLISQEPRVVESEQLHKEEHSLEVQIPFLQVVQPQALIVPLLINDHSFTQTLATALIKTMQAFPQKRFLVIVSTDMTHYRPEKLTQSHDQKTLDLIKELDTCGLERAFVAKEGELCGAAAVLTVLAMLQAVPKPMVTSLAYATSGDVSADKTRVVGYGATMATFGRWQEAHIQETTVLTFAQKKQLMTMARQTLKSYLATGEVPDFPITNPTLKTPRAVFVTLRDRQGKLRGCIGRIFPDEALALAVQQMTIEAAVNDSRFVPVRPEEVDDLTVEISILSYPQRVCDVRAVQLGTHGVILKRDGRRGIFLPEVAESFSKKEEFLGELCAQKAHLERQCWQDPQTQIDIFTSLHFSEKEFNG